MALLASITLRGVELPAAYVRVERVFGGKHEGWSCLASVYASQQAAAGGAAPLEQFNHAADYAMGVEPYGRLYAAIKAERFAGAADA